MGRWTERGIHATGGPGRVFLGAAGVGCLVVAAVLAFDHAWSQALIAAAAAGYFALRFWGGLGSRREK